MICKFIQINLRKMCRIPHLLVFPVNMMHSQLTGINQLLSLQFNITFIFFVLNFWCIFMSFHLTDNYKQGSSRQGYSENDLIFTFSNRGGIFRSHLFLVWSWCKCFFERFFLPLDTVWIGLFSWLIVHCIQRHITLVKLEPRLWCNCGQMAYKSIIIRQVYIYRYFLQVN